MAYNRDLRDREKKEKTDVVRDEKGRWLPGGASPHPQGRSKREIEISSLERLNAVVNEEQWEKMVDAIMKRAQAGDVQAFKVLADYKAGKPTERISVVDEKEEQEIIISFGEPTPDIIDRVNGMQKLLTETSEDDT